MTPLAEATDLQARSHDRKKAIAARIDAAAARLEGLRRDEAEARIAAAAESEARAREVFEAQLAIYHAGKESPGRIIARVAAEHGLTKEDLIGHSRVRSTVRARWAAVVQVHLAYPNYSLGRLGDIFGGKDHTTILHGLRKMGFGSARSSARQRSRPWLPAEIEQLRRQWEAGISPTTIAIAVKRGPLTVKNKGEELGLTRPAFPQPRAPNGSFTNKRVA